MNTLRNPVDIVSLNDIASALSDATGQRISENNIQSVGGAAPGAEVADATQKFLVTLQDTKQGFLIVSGSVNPDLIERAAHNIEHAHALLRPVLAAPILPTIATGRVKGLSFALWPFRTALLNGGKVSRYIRRRHHAIHICRWHIDLVEETLITARRETCEENLTIVLENSALTKQMRSTALQALESLANGKLSLQHCLQHGDFWIGNILVPNRGDDAAFFVIDWAGMNRNGYPFIDLCSMLMSLRCSRRFASGQLAALQSKVGCDRIGLLASVLNGLGYLGKNLEHFPPERYHEMAKDIFNFADTTSL